MARYVYTCKEFDSGLTLLSLNTHIISISKKNSAKKKKTDTDYSI